MRYKTYFRYKYGCIYKFRMIYVKMSRIFLKSILLIFFFTFREVQTG